KQGAFLHSSGIADKRERRENKLREAMGKGKARRDPLRFRLPGLRENPGTADTRALRNPVGRRKCTGGQGGAQGGAHSFRKGKREMDGLAAVSSQRGARSRARVPGPELRGQSNDSP